MLIGQMGPRYSSLSTQNVYLMGHENEGSAALLRRECASRNTQAKGKMQRDVNTLLCPYGIGTNPMRGEVGHPESVKLGSISEADVPLS